jgi:hypothetical protein
MEIFRGFAKVISEMLTIYRYFAGVVAAVGAIVATVTPYIEWWADFPPAR